MPPISRTILNELQETCDRWWLFSLLFNLLGTAVISGTTLMAFVAADWWLHLSADSLQVCFAVWCAISLSLLITLMILAITRRRSLAAAARRLEMSFPELGSDLINLVQLSEWDEPDNAFHQAAVADAANRVADFPFSVATYGFTFPARWRLATQTGSDVMGLASTLLLLSSVAILLHFAAPDWSMSLNRVLMLN